MALGDPVKVNPGFSIGGTKISKDTKVGTTPEGSVVVRTGPTVYPGQTAAHARTVERTAGQVVKASRAAGDTWQTLEAEATAAGQAQRRAVTGAGISEQKAARAQMLTTRPEALPQPGVRAVMRSASFYQGRTGGDVYDTGTAQEYQARQEFPRSAWATVPMSKAQEWLYQKGQDVKGPLSQPAEIGAAIPAAALGVGSFIVQGVTHPVKTFKSMLDPRTYYEFGQQLAERPTFTVVKTGTEMAALGKITQGAARVIPKFRYTTEVPGYKGVSVEWRGRGQPLVGRVTEYTAPGRNQVGGYSTRTVLGTPKMELPASEFIPETGAGGAIVRASIPATEQAKLGLGLDIMRATQSTRSSFRSPSEPTETLGRMGVRIVERGVKGERGAMIYGSKAAERQMIGARRSADIDVQLTGSTAEAEIFAQRRLAELKAVGETVRISPDRPLLIESKRGGNWRHAVDIHSADEAITELSSPGVAGESVYGLRLGQKPIKIEGIRYMPLSEQGLRKGASMFTVRGGDTLAPRSYRLKDVSDFFATQEALAQSKVLGGGRVSSRIAELKTYYPEELTTGGRVVLDFAAAPRRGAVQFGPPVSVSASGAVSVPRSVSPGPPSISPSFSISASRGVSPVSYGISPSAPRSPSLSPSFSVPASPYGFLSPSLPRSVSRSVSASVGSSPSLSPSLSPSPYSSPASGYRPPPPPQLLLRTRRQPQVSRRRRARGGVFNPLYVSSVEAAAFNVRGPMPGKITAGSGLTLRPLVG